MIRIVPSYYSDFKCIADRCKHSCCVGWEIEIDEITLRKYEAVRGEYLTVLKSNIEPGSPPHFKLDKGERCPFLNKNGLCDIITNLGEDMLCQICSDHPRFRNFYGDYEEIGLGLSCEAAAQIILSKKEKTTLNLTNEALKIPEVSFRQKIFELLQDRSTPLYKRVQKMLELVGAELDTTLDWYEIFYNLERLDTAWDGYLLRIKKGLNFFDTDTLLDEAYEQLLVYLIYRHFLDYRYDAMIKERVLFAALAYMVIKTMNAANTLSELIEIARLFSAEIEYSDENINALLLKLR